MAEEIDVSGIENHVKKWLKEALEAGRTVCELNGASPPFSPELSRLISGRLRTEADQAALIAEMDKHRAITAKAGERFQAACTFFLIALNKAARWADKWKKVVPEHAGIADGYLSKYKPNKDLRDILEHDDEYLTGGGWHPEKLVQTTMGGAMRVDAFSTLTIDGQIFIGGTLSVQGMMQAAAEFEAALVALRRPADPY